MSFVNVRRFRCVIINIGRITSNPTVKSGHILG